MISNFFTKSGLSMKKILILSSFFIIVGFNLQVNADRAEQGMFGGLAGGALLGGLAGGGKGAAIGGIAGAGLGYAMGKDADRRARRERRYIREYQTPPAYVDYGDEDVVYVPVRRQRYVPHSYPRANRRVATQPQRIIYQD